MAGVELAFVTLGLIITGMPTGHTLVCRLLTGHFEVYPLPLDSAGHKYRLTTSILLKQGVALTGRNHTVPPCSVDA